MHIFNKLFSFHLIFTTALLAKDFDMPYNGLKSYNYNLYMILLLFLLGSFIIYNQLLLKKLKKRVEDEISKNKLKDSHIVSQSRLAQMGEMVSMIAHQWRQPLNAISVTAMKIQLNIELDKYDFSKEKEKNKFIRFAKKEFNSIDLYVNSLNETLEDFRNFYNPNKKAELLVINSPIKTALCIVKSSLKVNNIKLVEDYKSKQELCIFKNELIQVLLNLLKNSQDSLIEQNTKDPMISIQTKDTKDGICIKFMDNGSKIEEEILNKIFTPYFSTKDEKNGTGLGLYMSKIIIEEHHKGNLQIKNRDGGVQVVIKIPIL